MRQWYQYKVQLLVARYVRSVACIVIRAQLPGWTRLSRMVSGLTRICVNTQIRELDYASEISTQHWHSPWIRSSDFGHRVHNDSRDEVDNSFLVDEPSIRDNHPGALDNCSASRSLAVSFLCALLFVCACHCSGVTQVTSQAEQCCLTHFSGFAERSYSRVG